MTLLLFFAYFLALRRYVKISWGSSYIYALVIFYPLLYVVITSCNWFHFDNFALHYVIHAVLIACSLKMKMPDYFAVPKNKLHFFYWSFVLLLAGIVFVGTDFTWDSLAYRIDGIYGYINSNNLLDRSYYTHYWAQNYLKLGELIMSSFSAPLGQYSFYIYGLANTLFILGFLPLMYGFVRKFRIDEKVAPLLGIFFICAPLIIVEAPSGYNDIMFVWYLVTLIFFVTEKMKPATLFLFIFCCIGVMNLKYSGFFLGGLLCAIFFFGNLRRLRLSFLLFLPLFLLGFNGYIHNYVATGYPLTPFKNLGDIRAFEANLGHKPEILKQGGSELYYAHIFSPHIDALKHIDSGIHWWGMYVTHVTSMGSYGPFWIFILLISLVQIVLHRKYIYREKKLLVSLLIVAALYSLQSVKWEIRYFLYLPFFVSFLMFLKWEEKSKKYQYSIYALCVLQLIASYAMVYGYMIDRSGRSTYYDVALESDFSGKKHYFFRDTDFKHLYHYFGEKYGTYPQIINSQDLATIDLKNAVIINDDSFHQNGINDIRNALEAQKIPYTYNKNLGFVTN